MPGPGYHIGPGMIWACEGCWGEPGCEVADGGGGDEMTPGGGTAWG